MPKLAGDDPGALYKEVKEKPGDWIRMCCLGNPVLPIWTKAILGSLAQIPAGDWQKEKTEMVIFINVSSKHSIYSWLPSLIEGGTVLFVVLF